MKSGALKTALALLLALGPFEKNHPAVEEGLRHYEAGRYEQALKAFDAAKQELPDSAAVEFNRGNALYKLRRLEEARDAYHRVAELDRGQLRQKDYYNLGNVWAELGQSRDAVAAYRKALVLDPRDEAARHNLEVVLRQLPPPRQPQPQPDGGSDAGTDGGRDGGADGGRGDGGSDGGQGQQGPGDGGRPDPKADGGTRDGGQGQPQRPDDERRDGGEGDPADPEQEPPEEGGDGGVEEAELHDLSKKDVERLLDSMKQSEKNLQLWRFQQRKKPRKDHAKDW